MMTNHTPAPWKAHKTPNDPDFGSKGLADSLDVLARKARVIVAKVTGEQA